MQIITNFLSAPSVTTVGQGWTKTNTAVPEVKISENATNVVLVEDKGLEHSGRLLWSIFDCIIGSHLGQHVERKTLQLIRGLVEEQVDWSDQDAVGKILVRARRNFGKNWPEVFQLKTTFFNRHSPLLQHFCCHVAHAEALDDVYNALGSFIIGGKRVWPESYSSDPWARFYLGCPNGQAVRNRYRLVAKLFTEFGGGRTLSIACGSAQAIIQAAERMVEVGKEVQLLLTDANQKALEVALRRAEMARVANRTKCLQVPFAGLSDVLNGGRFDTIEACGILDYLPDRTAGELLSLALSRLHRGGVLIVSNMAPTRGATLLTKMYNWDIIYRAPERLAQLISLAGGKNVTVYVEPWGIHPVAIAINT